MTLVTRIIEKQVEGLPDDLVGTHRKILFKRFECFVRCRIHVLNDKIATCEYRRSG